MASQFKEKKLLFADLFKGDQITSSSPTTESAFGSNESTLSSPFGSEVGSTEETSGSDDEDFVSELTRQMAEHMLKEDEDEDNSQLSCASDESKSKNQLAVKNQGRVERGRRVRGSEFTQQKRFYRTVQQHRRWGNGLYCGSGMTAVFLGASGSNNGPCGTGVFLPRGSHAPGEHKKQKRSGVCSTVLIPNRVLQTLELHFNGSTPSEDPASYPSLQNLNDVNTIDSPRINGGGEAKMSKEMQTTKEIEIDEMQLPQEWTY